MYLKHDINICACACALAALILLPVVNVSQKMDSATSICYNYNVKILASDAAFAYYGDFALCVRRFDHITTSGLKPDVIFEFRL